MYIKYVCSTALMVSASMEGPVPLAGPLRALGPPPGAGPLAAGPRPGTGALAGGH